MRKVLLVEHVVVDDDLAVERCHREAVTTLPCVKSALGARSVLGQGELCLEMPMLGMVCTFPE